MDPWHLRDLYDRQLRRGARPDGPGCRIEHVEGVVRQTGPEHAWNGVLWSGLDPRTADRAIAAQIAHYRAEGLPFEWKLYAHDTPADLGDRLLAAGFTAEDPETLMVAEATTLPDLSLPDGVELRAVTDESGVRQVVEVHARAFGTDSTAIGVRLLERLGAEPGAVPAVVALADGEPVSAARLELHPGTDFAGLWGGGTVEGWRGRGLYRALVCHRARIAAAHGHRYVQVDAADTSRPILRSLGFQALTTTTPYTHAPTNTV
ncbi:MULTISPECIES: GNAT family N-acetyltransferase [unclassified Streptomyces]|uniref:GNAT family N-acetyltransferase n=1 Tax=unclassified Streptomyces TaxID=2593676 RepID=UPI0016607D4B|nr:MULTISPECIES: GNAT family N-acetyltransferase [unclassified Streptomyces]MBD0708730.1 GNAT family N-acetyltransferase [Streptomyces sp. CBMA291]MBD0714589.1 GNAT family N-acetyltransferase [Streptomyces sp. CBMA370]